MRWLNTGDRLLSHIIQSENRVRKWEWQKKNETGRYSVYPQAESKLKSIGTGFLTLILIGVVIGLIIMFA